MTKGLHHVAVRTSDIERAARFYTETLGFHEKLRLHFDDGSYLIQLEQDGSIVELFGGGKSPAPDRGEIGYTHIALAVESVDAEYDRLTKLGFDFHVKPQTVQGIHCAFFRDPDGNPIEIIE